jgi:hypothetical protein
MEEIPPMLPLALTDSQMDAVFAAARPLPVNRRDQFLQDVATALGAETEIGPGTVFRVIKAVQRSHWDPPWSTEMSAAKYR